MTEGHAFYIAAAYGTSALVLALVALSSFMACRRAEKGKKR